MSGRLEQLLNIEADFATTSRSRAEVFAPAQREGVNTYAAGMERVIAAVRSLMAAEDGGADPVREDWAKALDEALVQMVLLTKGLHELGCPGEAERLKLAAFKVWCVMREVGGKR